MRTNGQALVLVGDGGRAQGKSAIHPVMQSGPRVSRDIECHGAKASATRPSLPRAEVGLEV